MESGKNSFVVYAADIKETIDSLTNEQVGELFRGMVDYMVTGDAPKFSGVLKFAFIPIRQQMDRDSAKWQRTREKRVNSGRLGGLRSGEVRREKAEVEANEASALKSKQTEANRSKTKQNEANEAVNVNVNVNDNVNVNVSDSFDAVSDGGADASSLSSVLISYLNEKAGGRYKVTEETTRRIGELLAAGYTEADMKNVIDKKVSEWKDDPKMRSFLRPRTLFGSKFEEYADAPAPIEVEEQQNREQMIVKLREQRKLEEETLAAILEQLEAIRNGPGGIKGNWNDYRTLSEQKAIRESNIEVIDKKLEKLGRMTA